MNNYLRERHVGTHFAIGYINAIFVFGIFIFGMESISHNGYSCGSKLSCQIKNKTQLHSLGIIANEWHINSNLAGAS